MKKNYVNFDVSKNEFYPNQSGSEVSSKLPPGMYKLKFNSMTGEFWFDAFESKHDSIIDLPSKEYTQVVSEMEFFLRPETKAKFQKLGYLYKRSAILHGLPGTGKTVIVNRVAQKVIKDGGVVLFVDNPNLLELGFEVLTAIQPDITTLCIFEEFDSMLQQFESKLLSILDGEVQKENVMYLATTNYIDRIPARIMRPGRFSSVVEVKYPSPEARKKYLDLKLGEKFPHTSEFVEKSNGLSIDELKEIVQSVVVLEQPLDSVVGRIKETKSLNEVDPPKEQGYTDFEEPPTGWKSSTKYMVSG